mgnify:CR=1 FL=1
MFFFTNLSLKKSIDKTINQANFFSYSKSKSFINKKKIWMKNFIFSLLHYSFELLIIVCRNSVMKIDDEIISKGK